MIFRNGKKLLSRTSPRVIRIALALTNVLLVLVVITFAWLYYEATLARAKAVPQLIHQRTEQFQDRLEAFFIPIVDDLAALRLMALKNVLSLDESDAEVTTAVVNSIIEKPSLSIDGFVLADTNGRELKWIKVGGQWHRVTSEDDISTRSWFKSALQIEDQDKVFWTEVYTFHSRQKPGITLAQTYRLDNDQTQYVIAFDIALDDFINYVTNMKVAGHEQLLLYSDQKIADLKKYAELLSEGSPGEADFWRDLSEVQDSLSIAAVSAWIKEAAVLRKPLKFSHENQIYWVEFEDLIQGSPKTKVAMLAPESSMIPSTRRIVVWLFAATGIGLMILAVLLGVLLRKQSRFLDEQLNYLGLISKNEKQLLAIIERGENNNLEFKSTLRWHLKANKPAKEIEIACMKTVAAFLNSDGGTLLVGVEDDGTILGIERDGFPNNDKFLLHFNNLLKQHLGLECARFVDFEIKTIKEKSVLVVYCRPSLSPIFVTHADKEEFYVRVGPGTRQLTTSKAMTYIKEHFV